MRLAAIFCAVFGLVAPACAGEAALRALEATIQQQAIIQQQQREQQQRQQQEQTRQREAMQPALIIGPDGKPLDAVDNRRPDKGGS